MKPKNNYFIILILCFLGVFAYGGNLGINNPGANYFDRNSSYRNNFSGINLRTASGNEKDAELFIPLADPFTLLHNNSCYAYDTGAADGDWQAKQMMFGDTSRIGVPFSKDPHVVFFGGRYLMYYSIPPMKGVENSGWNIGIAESGDLMTWNKVGEIVPDPLAEYEKKGLCAPGALVKDGKVHLFYQTYGNGRNDAICHAFSDDGIHFERNSTNPIFKPEGDWNCGRAIDAEVYEFNDRYFLYFATRDPDYKIQMLGVAVTPKETNFNREDWQQAVNGPILYPQLPWEGECIEGASITVQNNRMFMFYAGAYNNWPQQVGVAVSDDGLVWERLFDEPFLPNGKPGEWNESESGHPHIFTDPSGRTFLFFQGNNDKGKSWYISNKEVFWKDGFPTF